MAWFAANRLTGSFALSGCKHLMHTAIHTAPKNSTPMPSEATGMFLIFPNCDLEDWLFQAEVLKSTPGLRNSKRPTALSGPKTHGILERIAYCTAVFGVPSA